MKAYITCPVTYTKIRLNLLPIIEEIVKNNKLDAFVFQVGGNPKDIFERDIKQLEACDLIIAEVSEKSHGVGIELGIAYKLGLKIILLLEKGNTITKLAQGMPDTIIIEYQDIEDLKNKLNSEIQKTKKE